MEQATPRWALLQRFKFMENLMVFLGTMNRQDVVNKFNVTKQSVTTDLSEYHKLHPDGILDDKSSKTLVPCENFKPLFASDDVNAFFDTLKSDPEALGFKIEVAEMPKLNRTCELEVLRNLNRAIRDNSFVWVKYEGVERQQEEPRCISPHAYMDNGFRRSVRAWCYKDNVFKDFVLGRFVYVSPTPGGEGMDPSADVEWNTYVEYELMPNPAASASQRKVIERDYGMTDGTVKIKVKKVWARPYYFPRWYRLDGADESPESKPVVIKSVKDLN